MENSRIKRIKEYSDSIPQERTVTYDDNNPAPDASWPSSGKIEFDNAALRYRDGLPLVLKGLSFTAESGEKIGVVGRTGSGKSTLMLALFRMVELASGSIRVDGRDITQLQMSDLRKNVTIIPQDPTLFRGTVRSNLDPFHLHSDEAIWKILDAVNLRRRVEQGARPKPEVGDAKAEKKKGKKDAAKTAVNGNGNGVAANGTPESQGKESPSSPSPNGKATPTPVDHDPTVVPSPKGESTVVAASEPEKPTLDVAVEERGSNFSVGERQLMCLARALLKKSKILLLDEATASVDFEADALIQRTIRTEFADCTVLTIAHRLATVIDSDKILVLNDGELAEFAPPSVLLKDKQGLFYSMAQQLGEAQFNDLLTNAK